MWQWYVGSHNGPWSVVCIQRWDHYMLGMSERQMVSYVSILRWDHDMLAVSEWSIVSCPNTEMRPWHIENDPYICQHRDAAMICWGVRMAPGLLCLYTEMRPLHVGNVRKASGLLCLYTEMRPFHVGNFRMANGLMSVYRDGTITCRNDPWSLMSKYRDETMTCWVLPIHSYVSIEMQRWYIGSQNGTWSLMSVYRDENMLEMWESPVAVLDFSTGHMAHGKWKSVWARKMFWEFLYSIVISLFWEFKPVTTNITKA